jgi:3-hydroxyisobutyrate dehydrogenase-like beta-hydroxyacid dehydrogenase
MGTAIAQRLVEHGLDVVAWDRRDAAVRATASRGLRVGASPRAVADESELIISIVTEDGGVRRLFRGENGFLAGEVAGKLFIEMSTLQPMTSRELAPLVEQKGARFIDAPVLGSIPAVREGKLVVLAGGKPEDVDRARPALDKLARRIVVMGPVGSGHAMKLAANIGLAAYVQAIAESLALGEKQGLALDQMLDVLRETATAAPWLKAKVSMLRGEKGDISLDLRTLRKDVMSAVATAAATGVPLPLSAGTLAALSAAVVHGHGEEDIAALPKFFREFMGQKFD